MGTSCCQPIAQTPLMTPNKHCRALISEMTVLDPPSSRMTSHSSSVSVSSTKLGCRGDVLDAVSHRDLRSVQHFLETGFPINQDLNNSGWSLLHVAALNGDLPMLEFLISKGANLNLRDYDERWTPVMAAAMSDHPQIVKVLQEVGADMTLVDCHGRTAADLARIYKCDKVKSLWSERSA
mmetsp:Transcript_10793/g.21126  ORF Transcript_10793/g.21126 Transcript_10793/m.21126 type:complete len:180 (-) Transcript_10793:4505-5044(-)